MEESEGNVVYLNTVAAIPQKIVDAKEKELQKVEVEDLFEKVTLFRQSVVSKRGNFKEQKKGVKAQLVASSLQVRD